MICRKITIHTTEAAEDILVSSLMDLKIMGAEIQDRKPLTDEESRGMFIDILPDPGPDDGTAQVIFYVEISTAEEKEARLEDARRKEADPSIDASYTANADNLFTEEEFSALLGDLKETVQDLRSFCDMGEGRIEVSDISDLDWENSWKEYFHSFSVDGIRISPPWESGQEGKEEAGTEEGEISIIIDPGSAFGTGQHETTRLCLRGLRKYLKEGDAVLDVGTGSGILGIAALKLGAARVFGTDLDESVLSAVSKNLSLNGIPEELFPVSIVNLAEEMPSSTEEKNFPNHDVFDIACANILAPVIIRLIPTIGKLLKVGGLFLSSGILEEKQQEVLDAFSRVPDLFEVLEITHEGEWIGIAAKRIG